jgi:hypothetical protein
MWMITGLGLALLVAFLGLRSHRGTAARAPEPAGAPREQSESRANPAANRGALPPKPRTVRNG